MLILVVCLVVTHYICRSNSFWLPLKLNSRMPKRDSPKKVPFPEQFQDNDIHKILIGDHNNDLPVFGAYDLCCGLLIKMRAGVVRVHKRNQFKLERTEGDVYSDELFLLVKSYTHEKENLMSNWTPEELWETSVELTAKSININSELQKELLIHPLYPRNKVTGQIPFRVDFLQKVRAYHSEVRRPEGTFNLKVTQRLDDLSTLPREKCPKCQERKQIYCGSCGGIRMASAVNILPSRIELPFDVLLLLHWQESLHKCTGIHAGALASEGSVKYINWPRDRTEQDWENIVGALDATRDVLLFPSDNAVDAKDFDWTRSDEPADPEEPLSTSESADADSENSNSNSRKKWRLVVLEGSWNYAKTMAWQFMEYRRSKNLPDLPCVILHNVTGQYWRFHDFGNAAVSTIEAITYTAGAAGLSADKMEDMLCLFYLQKKRVLGKVSEEGGKPPKAIEVCGSGEGSWKELTNALEETERTCGEGAAVDSASLIS